MLNLISHQDICTWTKSICHYQMWVEIFLNCGTKTGFWEETKTGAISQNITSWNYCTTWRSTSWRLVSIKEQNKTRKKSQGLKRRVRHSQEATRWLAKNNTFSQVKKYPFRVGGCYPSSRSECHGKTTVLK